jgi:hypothetical protein
MSHGLRAYDLSFPSAFPGFFLQQLTLHALAAFVRARSRWGRFLLLRCGGLAE